MGMMQELAGTSTLFGANAPFIEELYERYLADPASVDAEWRAYFDELRGDAADVVARAGRRVVPSSSRATARSRGAMVDATTMHKQVLVLRLISKYRTLGMLAGRPRSAEADARAPTTSPDLDLATYGFSEADLDTEFDVGSFKAGPQRMRLRDLVDALQETYTRTLGAEYMYITDTRDQALRPGARSSRSARARATTPRASASTSSSASPRPRRSSATCTRSTSARSASRARAATR